MNKMVSGSDCRDASRRPWLAKLQQARFTHLLIALSLLLFLSPFIGTFGNELGQTIAALLVSGLLAIVLVAAALAVSDNRRQRTVALVLAAACLMLTLLGHLVESPALRSV